MNQKRTIKTVIKDAFGKLLEDMKYVKWVILIVIAYFTLFHHFLYTTCPVVLITGFPCPGCGMTRAAFRVLRLDFVGAWRMHPFIYPIIVLVLIFCFQRYILLRNNIKILRGCIVAIAIGMLMFYIWRMWRYYPGKPPMSYYYGSLGYRIFKVIYIR